MASEMHRYVRSIINRFIYSLSLSRRMQGRGINHALRVKSSIINDKKGNFLFELYEVKTKIKKKKFLYNLNLRIGIKNQSFAQFK